MKKPSLNATGNRSTSSKKAEKKRQDADAQEMCRRITLGIERLERERGKRFTHSERSKVVALYLAKVEAMFSELAHDVGRCLAERRAAYVAGLRRRNLGG